MAQQAPEDPVRIDRSTRVLAENPDEDEIEIVNGILFGQMPGYEVQPNAVWDNPIEDVPMRDFSPPLDALKAHFAPLVRSDVTPIEIPPGSRVLVDRDSDLRMYRVRHVDWPDDYPDITVLISRRGEGTVVASS
jgi:hypothetical protein